MLYPGKSGFDASKAPGIVTGGFTITETYYCSDVLLQSATFAPRCLKFSIIF